MLKRCLHLGALVVLIGLFLAKPSQVQAQYVFYLPTTKQIDGLEFLTPFPLLSPPKSGLELNPTVKFSQTWNIPSPTSSPVMDNILVPSLLSESTPSALPNPIPTIETEPEPSPTDTPLPSIHPTAKPSPKESSTPQAGLLSADKLFAMVNDYRTSINLSSFQKNNRVCALAASRAPEINQEIASGQMHRGLKKRNLDYWNTENIISMNSEAAAFNWWIHDKIHKDAIEGNYKYSCIACSSFACAEEFTNFQSKT